MLTNNVRILYMYHTVETIITTEHRHAIVPHSGENHNYRVQTRDCTTQRRQSQLPSTDT